MTRSFLSIAGLTFILLSGLYSCTPKDKAILSSTDPYDTQELTEYMTGSFSSAAQAGADANYYNMTLQIVPIWPDEAADYLYVEQAIATKQLQPNRQRIYKLEKLSEGAYRASVYSIAHDSLFIGKWRSPTFFNSYSPSDLISGGTCAIILYQNSDGTYTGSTKDRDCGSAMKGASYETSVVDVRSDQISVWDQGFNDDGKQVWGAVDGPYVFLRKNKNSPRTGPAKVKQMQRMVK